MHVSQLMIIPIVGPVIHSHFQNLQAALHKLLIDSVYYAILEKKKHIYEKVNDNM